MSDVDAVDAYRRNRPNSSFRFRPRASKSNIDPPYEHFTHCHQTGASLSSSEAELLSCSSSVYCTLTTPPPPRFRNRLSGYGTVMVLRVSNGSEDATMISCSGTDIVTKVSRQGKWM